MATAGRGGTGTNQEAVRRHNLGTLLRHVRLGTIRRVGAGVCLLLAGLATYDLVTSL